MSWDKNEDEAFPNRHPGEPGGLRQDILDEIADHLACSGERERAHCEDSDETIERRVLQRFGNPNTIARRLWWDQMRETVMREWIQTGVLVVVGVALVVGVFFMGQMMARARTSEEAMRTAMEAAMKQIATSNQAVMQAMADQRTGNEALLAALTRLPAGEDTPAVLELSTIEIVVRRGTPDGPPAPEVKVELQGKGQNDDSMTVQGALDAEGRAIFERLYQGTYSFSFEDPQSGLSARKKITLFAGKGAGEYVIVAPDVLPRPVHVDWGLPTYGRDDELLVGTTLKAAWGYEGLEWVRKLRVGMGHDGTWGREGEDKALHLYTNVEREALPVPLSSLPCVLAGEISILDTVTLYRNDGAGGWHGVRRDTIVHGRTTPRPSRIAPATKEPMLRELSDGEYVGKLPEDLFVKYSQLARVFRGSEYVPAEEYAPWLRTAATTWTDAFIVAAGGLADYRSGEWQDGALYSPQKPEQMIVYSGMTLDNEAQRSVILPLPDKDTMALRDSSAGYLALLISRIEKRKYTPPPPKPTVRVGATRTVRPRLVRPNTAILDDLSGNNLLAYAIRTEWQGKAWPQYDPESPSDGVTLVTDETPFWRITGEALGQMEDQGSLFIPLTRDLYAESDVPVTGVLLRWENESDEFDWVLNLRSDRDDAACWLVMEPIDAAVNTPTKRPSKDFDGRFHYDSLKSANPVFVPEVK